MGKHPALARCGAQHGMWRALPPSPPSPSLTCVCVCPPRQRRASIGVPVLVAPSLTEPTSRPPLPSSRRPCEPAPTPSPHSPFPGYFMASPVAVSPMASSVDASCGDSQHSKPDSPACDGGGGGSRGSYDSRDELRQGMGWGATGPTWRPPCASSTLLPPGEPLGPLPVRLPLLCVRVQHCMYFLTGCLCGGRPVLPPPAPCGNAAVARWPSSCPSAPLFGPLVSTCVRVNMCCWARGSTMHAAWVCLSFPACSSGPPQ